MRYTYGMTTNTKPREWHGRLALAIWAVAMVLLIAFAILGV